MFVGDFCLEDFMRRPVFASLFVLSLPLAAHGDPLLDAMRNLSQDGPIYAYEMTYSGQGVTATGKIDPSQPEGKRIELYSPSMEDLPKDFREGLEDMDADADGEIWCSDFAERVPNDASVTEEREASVVYAFSPVPEADADKNEQKMMKQLDGRVEIDKTDGSVLSFHMRLPKPYKPAMVAKINAFEMSVSCARAPDGRTYVETFDFDISGSAMMQSFDESISRTITKLLDPVG